MRTKQPVGKGKKNLVKDLTVNEVSFCGAGMNPGAHVALFKSVDPEVVKATFTEVLSEMELAEGVEEMIEMAFEMNHALARSLYSIISDEEVKDKKAAIKASLGEFVKALQGMAKNSAVFKAVEPAQWIEENREEDLTVLVDLITKTLKEDNTMSKELEGKLKKAEEEAKKAKEALEKAQADLVKANTIALMTDDQKDFYKALDPKAQEEFLKLSPEEMAKKIEKAQADDETITVAGVPVRKSDVGPASFAIFKAQQKENDDLRKKNEKAAEIAVAKAYQTEAEKDFPNLPGSVEHKGSLLKAIDGLPEEEKAASRDLLKAANTAMGKNFTEDGHEVNTGGTDAEAKLNKMAEDLATKAGISVQKAYSQVMSTPEGAKLYEESLKQK